MTKITSPIIRLLPPRPRLTPPKINPNLQILALENPPRALLIHSLGLPIHQEPQLRAPIHRHKTHARSLRHNRPRPDARRVAHRAQDAPPVGVLAVEGGLDERGGGDGGGDGAGGFEGCAVHDADADEFCGALAVADDQVGEVLGEAREDGLHGAAVGGGGRGDGGAGRGAVGEDGDGVVGAGIAVDGDGVEGVGDGVGEEGGEGGGGDGGVGAEDAEEGGHVGVDHARAFGHAREVVGRAWGGGEGEGAGEEFGEGVGGADGAGGC